MSSELTLELSRADDNALVTCAVEHPSLAPGDKRSLQALRVLCESRGILGGGGGGSGEGVRGVRGRQWLQVIMTTPERDLPAVSGSKKSSSAPEMRPRAGAAPLWARGRALRRRGNAIGPLCKGLCHGGRRADGRR